MTVPGPLSGVARTAVGVARMRAAESRRPDRLFDDPYAELFEAAAPDLPPPESPESGTLRGLMAFQTVIRTRFYDDFLLRACAGVGRPRQVVLLAAGLDTRAYRLAWPDGVAVYEIDAPDVLAFKDRTLADVAPRCERVACPADLREDWAERLAGAGFEPGRPTVWLAEGLLIYLSAEEAGRLLRRVGELSAPGARIALEQGDSVEWLRSMAEDVPALARVLRLWKGGLGDDTCGWMGRHGWRTRAHELGALAEAYGRPVPGGARSGFLTAEYG
ncbi:SAM-dependent methyltransferase [Actinomadura yumaensis]|uniref:S-adenosyl-L-methionine-dependent methyltransferase n=1 Tax=Actinomadura yumaensis TaxID=111807 RepID=A0ABW2CXK7_9ACTN